MTDDDELRAHLSALDPLRRDPGPRSFAEPTPTEIQELVMATIDQHSHSPQHDGGGRDPRGDSRFRQILMSPLALTAGVVAVAALLVGGYLAAGIGKGGGTEGTASAHQSPKPVASAPAHTLTTLALKAGGGGAGAMCIPFDPAALAQMPVAFVGAVVATAGDVVTLKVEKWFAGGTQEEVTVTSPGGPSGAVLDGVDFSGGGRFLVTATDGTVNGCGYSGPATPELEQVYANAFAR